MTLRVWNYRMYFFFSSRRRHTRFKCDWSSDVCSSDLGLRSRSLLRVPDCTAKWFLGSTPAPTFMQARFSGPILSGAARDCSRQLTTVLARSSQLLELVGGRSVSRVVDSLSSHQKGAIFLAVGDQRGTSTKALDTICLRYIMKIYERLGRPLTPWHPFPPSHVRLRHPKVRQRKYWLFLERKLWADLPHAQAHGCRGPGGCARRTQQWQARAPGLLTHSGRALGA